MTKFKILHWLYGPWTLIGIVAISFLYAIARFFWTHVCRHLFNL